MSDYCDKLDAARRLVHEAHELMPRGQDTVINAVYDSMFDYAEWTLDALLSADEEHKETKAIAPNAFASAGRLEARRRGGET